MVYHGNMKGEKSAKSINRPIKKTRGKPRLYDREAVLARFAQYIDSTPLPFIATFCADEGVPKSTFLEWAEGAALRDVCKTKEESGFLEAGVTGKMNVAFVLFGLKNLGYSDSQSVKHSGEIKTDNTLRVIIVDPDRKDEPAKKAPVKKK